MSNWIRVHVPQPFRRAAELAICVGDEQGQSGELIPVASCANDVVIYFQLQLPSCYARGHLSLCVYAAPGSTTDVRLTIFEMPVLQVLWRVAGLSIWK